MKWFTLIGSIAMLSVAYADGVKDSKNRVAPAAANKGNVVSQKPKTQLASQSSKSQAASAATDEKDCCDFFFTADYLFWTAREQGLEYATTGIALTSLGGAPAENGHLFSPDWKWSSGFKVGAGITFNERNWDLYLNYTWLHSNASDTHTLQPYHSATLFPYSADNAIFYLLNGITPDYSTAHSNWDLHLNVLDLELGRTFLVSEFLVLRPHFGLKASWQEDDFHHRYVSIATSTGGTISGKRDQDYWGLGLRAGVKSKWFFVKHWGAYGDLAISALWSHYDLHNTDTVVRTDGVTTPIMDMKETVRSLQPVIEIALGLLYETDFNDGKYRFNIHAGWEMQSWINQNQRIALVQVGSKGDLSLQGLTAGLRFDF